MHGLDSLMASRVFVESLVSVILLSWDRSFRKVVSGEKSITLLREHYFRARVWARRAARRIKSTIFCRSTLLMRLHAHMYLFYGSAKYFDIVCVIGR